jgi:tRNA A37 threonylcarbamoyladenosine dehydratase
MFWDGDIYEPSNLNRQNGCLESTIGLSKVSVLTTKINNINSKIALYPKPWYFGDNEQDFADILTNDIVFMAADCYYNINVLRPLLRAIILKGIPIIDGPINIIGGSVYIETKNDLTHFDDMTKYLTEQSNRPLDSCSQTAYKCALIAAEAVNQMVLYFKNSRYACIDTQLNIDIYHHKYT